MLTTSFHAVAHFMAGRGTAFVLIAAILAGSALGIVLPEAGNLVSGQIDFTILLLVFLLLFDVRLQAVLSSVNRLPFIAAALIANFVIIPALGFAIASVFLSAHPLFFIGLLIYFVAPCTDWFLGFTRLAKGNTALGAALLPINMIIQLLLYPVYLHLFGVDALDTGVSGVFQTLWQWFFIPFVLALGSRFIAERVLRADHFDLLQSGVALTVPILLAILVGQIAAANIGTLMSHLAIFPLILSAIFVFFVATFLLSKTISTLMKLTYEDRVLLTMTTAARNAPLMLALTLVVIPDQPVIYAAIIIGMLIELPHLVALKMILTRQRPELPDTSAVLEGEPSAR
ncbi:MAG: arsenic resistance protein [Pseudomonadota bacterium]